MTEQAEAAPAAGSVLTGATSAPVEATEAQIGEGNVSQPEVNQGDFLSTLPEEYRGKIAQKGFNNVGDIVKAYDNLETKLGKRFEDLTGDEIKEMNTKLGTPEDYSGYDLSFEGLPETPEVKAEIEATAKAFHEMGIPKAQAESLYNWYMTTQMESMQNQQVESQNSERDNIESLKKEFGSAFDSRVEMANDALRELGGEEAISAIQSAGLGNNPAVVKMLSEAGKLLQEDTAVGGKEPSRFGVTPAEASEKIGELYKDAEFMRRWSDQMDPGHDAAVQQLESLYKLKAGR